LTHGRDWRSCGRRQVRTRKAILRDAAAVHRLVADYANEGTLLPRSLEEICENIRDFTVAEDRGRVIGCGALHFYGPHLTEIRSIAVDRNAQGRGAGRKLMQALLAEVKDHGVSCVCLFTRIPEFFARLGFSVVSRNDLPEKLFKDCFACPRLYDCDEIAMIMGELPPVPPEQRERVMELVQLSR